MEDNQKIKKDAEEVIKNLEKLCGGIQTMTEQMYKSMGPEHHELLMKNLQLVKADETLNKAGETIAAAKKALNDLKF